MEKIAIALNLSPVQFGNWLQRYVRYVADRFFSQIFKVKCMTNLRKLSWNGRIKMILTPLKTWEILSIYVKLT